MRLIDAGLLREDILNDSTFDNDTINYYLNMVDGMETAFDVDKVVERLEKISKGYKVQYRMGVFATEDDVSKAIKRAIELVKGAVKYE